MWRPQLEALGAQGAIAVAPDLPGHGERSDAFTLESALATIESTIESLPGAGPVVLVGLSLGGYLAMEFAGRHPERIDGLIPMACSTPPIAFGVDVYRAMSDGLIRQGDRGMRTQRLAQTIALGPAGAEDFLAGGIGLGAALDAIQVVAGLDPVDAIRRATRGGLPVWFVSGQFDQMRIGERRFRAVAPDAWHTIVPFGLHVVNLAKPAAVNRLLTSVAAVIAGRAPSHLVT